MLHKTQYIEISYLSSNMWQYVIDWNILLEVLYQYLVDNISGHL